MKMGRCDFFFTEDTTTDDMTEDILIRETDADVMHAAL